MLGRGFPRLLRPSSCFFAGGKEVEGPAKTPSDEGRPREAEVSLSWGGHPFEGGVGGDAVEERAENWEILELKLVEHSGVCRIGGLGGRVLGAQSRERNGEEGGRAGETA